MQVALEVNESTSDQLPSTTTEPTSGVQQTRTSEGLTAPSQPNSSSAADQQQLMNFLYSESSGTVYTGQQNNETTSTSRAIVKLGIGTLIVIVAVGLAIICQRQLDKLNAPRKSVPKRKPRNKR
jgi:hypothetical protein